MSKLYEKFKTDLNKFLQDCRKLIILPVGNPIFSDDSISLILGKRLKKKGFNVFLGFQSPESYFYKILKTNPSHVMMIDVTDMGLKPGMFLLFSCEDISLEYTSTHNVPLKTICEMFNKRGIKTALVLIQLKRAELGKKPSLEVLRGALGLEKLLVETAKNKCCLA
ncbi:MAG: hydrogenase maturation protease [Thermoproteota archaeon]|nr:hydrogenase maturation protease [Candidatus Brockarchaeota archaeon]